MRTALLLLLISALAQAQDDPWGDDDWEDETSGPAWSYFIEAGLGSRLYSDDTVGTNATLEELRFRLESEWQLDSMTLGLKADAGYDGIEEDAIAEIRDLTVAFTLGAGTDVRLGRQVQTWGTGDLVFLNDLFPKDFVSFFAGRDDDYLKAPGDAVRLTRYTSSWNIDAVWTPVFEPDVYLTGERFSFFSPLAGRNVAPSPPLAAVRPGRSLSDGEFALRLFRTTDGREYALYAYRGYFKQPSALTVNLAPTFAPMTALGASLRRPLGPGLVNVEGSLYLSQDDRRGTNPLLPNDQVRLLAGYEWEAKPNFTVGLQYYVEWTLDHDELVSHSLFPTFEPDRLRHLLTNRLTYRMARDRHTFSLFTFLSPSDRDFYLRPVYNYRHDDHWSIAAGAGVFGGDRPHTFFKQLRDASNAYLRIRYNY